MQSNDGLSKRLTLSLLTVKTISLETFCVIHSGQGSQTHGPWTACGTQEHFVRHWMRIRNFHIRKI